MRIGSTATLILCLLAIPVSWAPATDPQAPLPEAGAIDKDHLATLILPVSVKTLNSPPTVEIRLNPTGYGKPYLVVKPYDPNTKQDIRVLRLKVIGPTSTQVCIIGSPFRGKPTFEGDLKPHATVEGELLFRIKGHRGRYTALCLVEDEEYRTVTALSWEIR